MLFRSSAARRTEPTASQASRIGQNRPRRSPSSSADVARAKRAIEPQRPSSLQSKAQPTAGDRAASTSTAPASTRPGRRKLSTQERTYEGYGASLNRAAPAGITDLDAWERAAKKVGKPYDSWGPKDFAKATAIYKHVIRKMMRGL